MVDLHKLLNDNVLATKTDVNGRITYTTKAFENISGYSKEELLKTTHRIVRHPDMPKKIFTKMWKEIKSGKQWRGELLNRRKDGTSFWVDTIISPEYNDDGDIIGFNAVKHDITAKKEAEHLASHDYLTKLPNRIYFENILSHAIKRAKRNKSTLAVLFIDFDDFKNINDTFDHQTGDKMLILFAERIKKALRESDTIARIGGDEFTVLLENITNQAALLDCVNKIFEVLKEPIEIGSHTFCFTASIGIAVYPADGDTMFDLMKHADHAMYHVKETGKNNYEFYNKLYSKRGNIDDG